jgi:formylglycine-generating enzyme required for sulfatase activity
MVVIPKGRFVMGFEGGEPGRYEGPPHAVRIRRAFAIGRFEVLTREYAAFVNATRYDSGPGCETWDAGTSSIRDLRELSWRVPAPGRASSADEPVVCVSWRDAQAYVTWLSETTGHRYRLASEAEWEYVARAGSRSDFPWGNDPEQGCRYANVYDATAADASKRFASARCSDGHAGVAAAGQYPANALGVHDMIGNVWEWTQDCYRSPYAPGTGDGTTVEVQGACELRSVRGGSWRTHMFRQRSSWRGRDPEDRKSDIFGFRVVREL